MFKARLKNKIPNEVNEVLHYLFNTYPNSYRWRARDDWKRAYKELGSFYSYVEYTKLAWKPNIQHEFFETEYWRDMADPYNFYHPPYIFCRCSFKNYNEEIEKFLSWIHPYLQLKEYDWIGTIEKEGCEEGEKSITLQQAKDGKIGYISGREIKWLNQ